MKYFLFEIVHPYFIVVVLNLFDRITHLHTMNDKYTHLFNEWISTFIVQNDKSSYIYTICSRTIPRAVIITMVVVIVLYVLTNVSLLAVLGGERIRQSQAVAMVTNA